MLKNRVWQILSWQGWFLLFAGIFISAWIHQRLGLALPIPWLDEAVYIWPAVSITEGHFFNCEYINPERPVLWQAPGLPFILSLFLYFMDPDLSQLRWMSWLFLCLAVILMAVQVSRNGKLSVMGALPMFFLLMSIPFSISANCIRQEPYALFFAVCGFFMLRSRRAWPALAVLSLSLFVHPNGIYFCVAGLVYAIWRSCDGMSWRVYRWGDGLLVLAVAGIWFPYFKVITSHFSTFVNDMYFSITFFKDHPHSFLESLFSLENIVAFALLAFVIRVHGLNFMREQPVFWFAALCIFIQPLRPEMWYDIYRAVGFGLTGALAAEAGFVWMSGAQWGGFRQSLCFTLVLLIYWGVGWKGNLFDGPRSFPDDMSWYGMSAGNTAAGVTVSEAEQIAALLKEKGADATSRVIFYPYVDGVAVYRESGKSFKPFLPVFSSVPPDFVVIRAWSDAWHTWWKGTWQDLEKKHELLQRGVDYRSSRGEAWYVLQTAGN